MLKKLILIFVLLVGIIISLDAEELEMKLLWKMDSVSHFLMSKDGERILYTTQKSEKMGSPEAILLNIEKDAKSNVITVRETGIMIEIRPELLENPHTKLFKDKIIHMGGKSGYYPDKVITKDLSGKIISEIPCYLENLEPIVSPTGKYVAIIPSIICPQYPSLGVYSTETGEKLWEKFTPEDIYYGGKGPPPFFIGASFITDDSLAVYYDKKVWLFNIKTGGKYWEETFLDSTGLPAWKGVPSGNRLSTSEKGDILFYHLGGGTTSPSYFYSFTNDGTLRWKKEGIKMGSSIVSTKGKYLLIPYSHHRVTFISNKDGNILWKANNILVWGVIFYGFNDRYCVLKGRLDEDPTNMVYIIKSTTGEVSQKFRGNRVIASENGKLLAFKYKDNFYLYQLSLRDGENEEK